MSGNEMDCLAFSDHFGYDTNTWTICLSIFFHQFLMGFIREMDVLGAARKKRELPRQPRMQLKKIAYGRNV